MVYFSKAVLKPSNQLCWINKKIIKYSTTKLKFPFPTDFFQPVRYETISANIIRNLHGNRGP